MKIVHAILLTYKINYIQQYIIKNPSLVNASCVVDRVTDFFCGWLTYTIL